MTGRGSGAKVAEANRARHRQRRAELAQRLGSFGSLTNREAAAALGVSAKTIRTLRDEYELPRPAGADELRLAGEANKRRAALRHAELAGQLERLGALTAGEAARVLGTSAHTVKRVRAEHPFLPSPRRPRTDREPG